VPPNWLAAIAPVMPAAPLPAISQSTSCSTIQLPYLLPESCFTVWQYTMRGATPIGKCRISVQYSVRKYRKNKRSDKPDAGQLPLRRNLGQALGILDLIAREACRFRQNGIRPMASEARATAEDTAFFCLLN
jgi:hypothetical protein